MDTGSLSINIVEERNDDLLKHHYGIYWRFLFLNLVVLWVYQSLISAQNYYIRFFPNNHLEFWGTVVAGSSMFLLHIIQLYRRLYKYGFTKCVIPGYIIIAILVISVKNPILLIIAFAMVGALGTVTVSPFYGIAGLFSTGSFTQALQVGGGLAGFLNVCANAIIRLSVLLFHSHIDQDQLSFYIFMSVLIILCMVAIYVYFRLIQIPSVQIRMHEQMFSFQREENLVQSELSFWELSLLEIFLVVPLLLKFIIISQKKTCLFSALIRTLFIIIIFYRHHIDNILLLGLITLLGLTNGLLATVTFMIRPKQIVGVNNYERAAYLMAAALYLEIAMGSIVAATLALTHVL